MDTQESGHLVLIEGGWLKNNRLICAATFFTGVIDTDAIQSIYLIPLILQVYIDQHDTIIQHLLQEIESRKAIKLSGDT